MLETKMCESVHVNARRPKCKLALVSVLCGSGPVSGVSGAVRAPAVESLICSHSLQLCAISALISMYV